MEAELAAGTTLVLSAAPLRASPGRDEGLAVAGDTCAWPGQHLPRTAPWAWQVAGLCPGAEGLWVPAPPPATCFSSSQMVAHCTWVLRWTCRLSPGSGPSWWGRLLQVPQGTGWGLAWEPSFGSAPPTSPLVPWGNRWDLPVGSRAPLSLPDHCRRSLGTWGGRSCAGSPVAWLRMLRRLFSGTDGQRVREGTCVLPAVRPQGQAHVTWP